MKVKSQIKLLRNCNVLIDNGYYKNYFIRDYLTGEDEIGHHGTDILTRRYNNG